MTDFLRTIRMALYICALPLVATAVVSAHSFSSLGDSEVASIVGTHVEYETRSVAVPDVALSVKHSLVLDESDGISGQILTRNGSAFVGGSELDVTLNYRGEVMARTVTSGDGQFRFEGVEPGSYTFIATSPSSITTFGVYVSADATNAPSSNEIQLSVAAATSNVGQVRNLLNSDVQSVSYSYTPTASERPVITETTVATLSSDGRFSGRVVPLNWLAGEPRFNLAGNSVYLFNQQGMVASAPVDAQGYYVINNVEPGVYDFVSFGPHGAAAMSIEITDELSTASTSSPNAQFASTAQPVVQDGLQTVLGEPTSGGPSVDVQVIVNQPAPQPFNTYPGGIGGGGGFGGDFGGLVGAALAAWVISEAINNDDGVINQPVVVPPVVLPAANSPF